jgi:hypothetical protein
MAERYFSREEAEQLLPLIESCLEEALKQKLAAEQLELQLAQAAARIMMLGGSIPPHKDLARKRAERDRLAAKVEQAIEKIRETGCVVKDLDEGLVDFPSFREGREVYLCWKLGEERVAYWHGLDEGFAGRKPLDASPEDPDEPPSGSGRFQ